MDDIDPDQIREDQDMGFTRSAPISFQAHHGPQSGWTPRQQQVHIESHHPTASPLTASHHPFSDAYPPEHDSTQSRSFTAPTDSDHGRSAHVYEPPDDHNASFLFVHAMAGSPAHLRSPSEAASQTSSSSASGSARRPKLRRSQSTRADVPRPPNAWILYRSAKLAELRGGPSVGRAGEVASQPSSSSTQNTQSNPTDTGRAEASSTATPLTSTSPARGHNGRVLSIQAELSKNIGALWRDEPDDVKNFYFELAEQKKIEHEMAHPDYKYQPRKTEKSVAARKARRAGRGSKKASVAIVDDVPAGPSQAGSVTRRRTTRSHTDAALLRLPSEGSIPPPARIASRPYPPTNSPPTSRVMLRSPPLSSASDSDPFKPVFTRPATSAGPMERSESVFPMNHQQHGPSRLHPSIGFTFGQQPRSFGTVRTDQSVYEQQNLDRPNSATSQPQILDAPIVATQRPLTLYPTDGVVPHAVFSTAPQSYPTDFRYFVGAHPDEDPSGSLLSTTIPSHKSDPIANTSSMPPSTPTLVQAQLHTQGAHVLTSSPSNAAGNDPMLLPNPAPLSTSSFADQSAPMDDDGVNWSSRGLGLVHEGLINDADTRQQPPQPAQQQRRRPEQHQHHHYHRFQHQQRHPPQQRQQFVSTAADAAQDSSFSTGLTHTTWMQQLAAPPDPARQPTQEEFDLASLLLGSSLSTSQNAFLPAATQRPEPAALPPQNLEDVFASTSPMSPLVDMASPYSRSLGSLVGAAPSALQLPDTNQSPSQPSRTVVTAGRILPMPITDVDMDRASQPGPVTQSIRFSKPVTTGADRHGPNQQYDEQQSQSQHQHQHFYQHNHQHPQDYQHQNRHQQQHHQQQLLPQQQQQQQQQQTQQQQQQQSQSLSTSPSSPVQLMRSFFPDRPM